MSNPWLKFYPRDWRGDQALRAVSIAARGLWMECLCIMHEATPYGHLLLNGNPVEGDTLARMTGTSVDEVSALMAELRQAGVLSVTGKGVVFSRRMTKDHARANKGRKAAKRRWNDDSQVIESNAKKEPPNGLPFREPITQKPETRKKTPLVPLKGIDEEFERFWKAYPRRDGANPKKPARDKFERHVKRGANPEAMIAAAEQYRQELERDGKVGTQFVAQAMTWLNQERWDVDPPEQDEPDYPAMASMLRNPDVDVSELLAIKQSQGNAAAEQFAKQFQQAETVQ